MTTSTPASASEVEGLAARLEVAASDPMWADHAEVSKRLLAQAAAALQSQAARIATLEGLGWQPIETAPKDGRDILVSGCSCGPPVRIACWGTGRYLGRVKGREWGWVDHPGHTCDPTHWMPLPAPPALAISNQEQGR